MDEDKAMSAVIDDMGRAAREYKARKYAPKAPPAPEAAPEAAADEGMPTMAEIASMLEE